MLVVGNVPQACNAEEAMKAIAYSSYGGPEVLTHTDLPEPKVGPGELLIRVKAAAVNPVDWKIMQGHLDPVMDVTFPAVPGWDVAGVVEKVGFDCPEWQVGDELIAYARKDWVQHGTWAEQLSVPVRTAARKPRSLTWEQAAALPLAGLTAYQTIHRLAVEAGQSVLIHAAGGGVGSFATQIAAGLGARVIGTGSPANHDRLRELGAEPVAYGEGLTERVRHMAPEGVDVVLDYIGGVVDVTTAVLAPGGRHVSIIDPTVIGYGGQYMWVRPSSTDLTALGQLVDEGTVRVDVAASYPLEQAGDAVRASMEGHTAGKIVLTVE